MALSIISPIYNRLSNITRNSFINLYNKSNVFSIMLNQHYSQLIKPVQEENRVSNEEIKMTKEIISKVNEVQGTVPKRTFAVVQICGKQFKVTSGDLITIESYWPPSIGDKIRLDKVLLAGSKDFSLIGTPLVQDGLVNIHATVIEKGLSHTKTHFKKKRRKQYMRINFFRNERTVLRINDIKIGELSENL